MELTSRFSDVFFVPGNHDLWVVPSHLSLFSVPQGDDTNSMEKIYDILSLCRRWKVETAAKRIGRDKGCWVCPILSWHHQSWDPEPDLQGKEIKLSLKHLKGCFQDLSSLLWRS